MHVTGPVAQYSVEIEYNSSCTSWMALACFRVLNNELLNKDPYVVTKKSSLILLDRKSAVRVAKTGNDTKHIRHISRRIHFVRNCEAWIFYKKVQYEGVLQLADIGTKDVRKDGLNPRLGYDMVRLDNWHNICKIWMI